ncbi:uncharacterized protein Triagg1_4456 [Trichoderma aggressivum f. europaeum]|uniref:Uncharacterized protein n=1 Tax=Trichoderma aggressivum f. europaeum TaxID=173218 RepID=A0AAE1IHK4_9HYPO|nr:hypothetical protein Triagg1_4456 [Trichoderma aggressivum f. europaeum]
MSGHGNSSHKHAGGSRRSTNNLPPDSDYRSFLFVINELKVDRDETYHSNDGWHNRIPLSNPKGYGGETHGTVMRYQSGRVTVAPGYAWYRGDANEAGWWPAGNVLMYSSGEGEGLRYVAAYKQLAVFSCGPFLPIVVVNGDPLSAGSLSRTPLLFHHPPLQPGISHAVHPESNMEPGPGPCKFVAGANPSWMPSLVPAAYSNPYNPRPSVGLSGELPIILGLMAFSESTYEEGAVDRTFLGDDAHRGKWRDGHWYRAEAPRGYAPSASEMPLGFLITVLYDPENPEYSNEGSLREMEWKEVLVREGRR